MRPGSARFLAEFRDLDAYVAALKGGDLRYTMTRPDVLFWAVDRVFLPDGLFVQSMQGGCGSILESGTPENPGPKEIALQNQVTYLQNAMDQLSVIEDLDLKGIVSPLPDQDTGETGPPASKIRPVTATT